MKMRLCIKSIFIMMIMTTLAVPVMAEEPTATVVIEQKEWALGIGKQKGEGVITYQEEDYPFKLSGLDYGSIGKVEMRTTGNVYNMETLEDFEGFYFQAKVALTIGDKGKTGMYLINSKGTTLYLTSKDEGILLSLGRAGIKITLLDEEEVEKMERKEAKKAAKEAAKQAKNMEKQ